MSAYTRVRWAAGHGLLGISLRRQARMGYLDAVLAVHPETVDDPYAILDAMRRSGPLYKGSMGYTTARHDVASHILQGNDFGVWPDVTRFAWPVRAAAKLAGRKPMRSVATPPSLSAIEPPEHTRLRRLFGGVFTPRALQVLRSDIEDIAETLLIELAGRARDNEPIDLVAAYTSQLPIMVISRILGIPAEMREQLRRWGFVAGPVLDVSVPYRSFDVAYTELNAAYRWMTQHLRQLRSVQGSGVFSQILQEQQGTGPGEYFTEEQLVMTAMQVLGAGFETTSGMLSTGVVQLARHPEQLAVLRDDPSLWPNAVDEILRYEAPIQSRARFAKRDIELGGTELPSSTLVTCSIGGANRDPSTFSDPDHFDVRRANAREHLAFGGGRHYCIGAALARAEGEAGLKLLFERFPDLALTGLEQRRGTHNLRMYETLPVRLKF